MTPTDRELGMSRPITRRDHDVGITALSMTLPLPGLAMPRGGSELYYPPTLTGLRGSTRSCRTSCRIFRPLRRRRSRSA